MPILIILAVAAGLLLLFLALRGRRPCRWATGEGGSRPPFSRWRCRACGVEAYSSDGRPPKECKRTLKAGL